MIVADTNLIVYLFVPGPHTAAASESFKRDPEWVVPPVYAYELLNVMSTHVRTGRLDAQKAMEVVQQATRTVQVRPDPNREDVLKASVSAGVGSYDCEFVVLARSLGTRVVTADAKMLKSFGGDTVSIDDLLQETNPV